MRRIIVVVVLLAVGFGVGRITETREVQKEIKVCLVPRKYIEMDGKRFLVLDWEHINLDSLLLATNK